MKPLLQAPTDPNEPQRGAADPMASVWVAASAGTGKTKVLTDRVLRLLLKGVAPERILCLTFTKAAAAEMRNRIMGILRQWATMDSEARFQALNDRFGRVASADVDLLASRLFARVLDAEEGLRIQTIHAFCESLLGRFPLEATIAPNFSGIDELEAKALYSRATESILRNAGRSFGIEDSLNEVTRFLDETRFQDVLREATTPALSSVDAFGIDAVVDRADQALRRQLGIGTNENAADCIANACADTAFDADGLRRAVEALNGGSKTDRTRAATIATWLAADPAVRSTLFSDYSAAFLTKECEPRAKLITGDAKTAFLGVEEALRWEAERLVEVAERQRASKTAIATRALLSVAAHVAAAYRRAKDARALLDYTDLIHFAIALLKTRANAPWVLYKLDGGIDHLLVDEAQDTSPEQWEIIRALTGEFFAGEGARDSKRTVFFVGDLKQSIYRFQGADPAAFINNQQFFSRTVRESGKDWRPIELDFSFRSTRAVLTAVDQVFAQPEARDGVSFDTREIVHRAFRLTDGGTVELWPLFQRQERENTVPWQPPREVPSDAYPQTRLANHLAKQIRTMMEAREILPSAGRPIRPGDIMVLVQRRTSGFMADLIYALKREGVKVAGEDRMILNEQIAVMDLMALAEFCLLPDDSLALASVLKSPLIGLDDDDLLGIAHPRGDRQTLWSALRARARTDNSCAEAVAFLREALRLADAVPPFEFFSRILGPLDGRKKLLARLGPEVDDPLREFLGRALAFERIEVPCLQRFLHWLKNGAVEIKRDPEQSGVDAVRVLTVHGAKGLQAPIVILPDTVRIPDARRTSVFWSEGEKEPVCIWRLPKEDRSTTAAELAARFQELNLQEYRRLLYVAMTRAQDRLIVCGWQTKNPPAPGCWYSLIRTALEQPLSDRERQQGLMLETAPDGAPYDQPLIRLWCPQTKSPEPDRTEAEERPPAPLPPWTHSPPPREPPSLASLAPSRALEARPPALSPLEGGDHTRFARGRLIHALLQYLPNIDADDREAAARRWLKRRAKSADGVDQETALQEVLAIIESKEFAHLFGTNSQAEVPVSGHLNGRLVTGRIDRLVVSDTTVDILDYKTDRPPPASVTDVAPQYRRQMSIYRDLLCRVFPDRSIRCHLLWTDGPCLMRLPDGVIVDPMG